MLETLDTVTWAEAGLLLAGLLGAGFLVSWICTGVLTCSRRAYIGVLALLTVVAWATFAAATGTSIYDTARHHWPAGLAAALVTGLLTGAALRKNEPPARYLAGSELRAAAALEGLVYGVAEGLLLSALPVFIAWQAAADAGWSEGPAWAVSLVASALMIVVHHLGYWDYRGPQVALVVAGCGLLSLGYLATGSLLAPALGHALMHVMGVTGGIVLPPHARPPAVQPAP
jgi:hypothetical protein